MGPPAAISDHAALGDGRTCALVTTDGTVDWLCLPDLDGTPVFCRVLDAEHGGAFALAPANGGTAERRYLPGTNVLETTWTGPDGSVRVTDLLAGGPGRDAPEHAPLLIRRVDGVAGAMSMAWRIAPRFGDGVTPPATCEPVEGGLRVAADGTAVSVGAEALEGQATVRAGESLVLTVSGGEAPVGAAEAGAELERTVAAWRGWSDDLSYDGPWRDAVLRSALALRLLVHEPTGALAAAGTLGLPEQPGGQRNFDYRFCWLRDASFVVDGFANLGDRSTPEHYLRWLARAIRQTTPVLQPFYRLDGGTEAPQREAALAGYGGARPVLFGNQAFQQRQLGSCGDILQSCALLHEHRGVLPDELCGLLVDAVDHVAASWREPDSGIWETSPPQQHTWSKMACWVALVKAADLADDGVLDGDGRRWREEAERVRCHVEAEHVADGAYVAVAGEPGLDAAVLLGVLMDFPSERWDATLAAIDAELLVGDALVYRTSALREQEQTFLPCAFWRAHALARLGRTDEAHAALEALVGVANDVGLFSEEAAPDGELWGNLPQGLTHAAFVNAAVVCHRLS